MLEATFCFVEGDLHIRLSADGQSVLLLITLDEQEALEDLGIQFE